MGSVVFLLYLSFSKVAASPVGYEVFQDKNEKYGLKSKGKVLVPASYDFVYKIAPCCVQVRNDSGWWAINLDSKDSLKAFPFDNGPDYVVEGLARYNAGGKIGFYDRQVRIRIPARFDFASPFHHGFSAFCMGCKEVRIGDGEHSMMSDSGWGVIDTLGAVIIEPKYRKVIEMEHGRFILLDGTDTVKIPMTKRKRRNR
jgi:hypothetical protein